MEGNPPPQKKVITYRHIKCFRNNLASITAVCTWRHHRSVSWTVLLHHYSDDRCHILNPEQPPTFTAVISVITTTTRPDRHQRHSRPLFVCAVRVCVFVNALLQTAQFCSLQIVLEWGYDCHAECLRRVSDDMIIEKVKMKSQKSQDLYKSNGQSLLAMWYSISSMLSIKQTIQLLLFSCKCIFKTG